MQNEDLFIIKRILKDDIINSRDIGFESSGKYIYTNKFKGSFNIKSDYIIYNDIINIYEKYKNDNSIRDIIINFCNSYENKESKLIYILKDIIAGNLENISRIRKKIEIFPNREIILNKLKQIYIKIGMSYNQIITSVFTNNITDKIIINMNRGKIYNNINFDNNLKYNNLNLNIYHEIEQLKSKLKIHQAIPNILNFLIYDSILFFSDNWEIYLDIFEKYNSDIDKVCYELKYINPQRLLELFLKCKNCIIDNTISTIINNELNNIVSNLSSGLTSDLLIDIIKSESKLPYLILYIDYLFNK